ncbi:Rv3235 family protein [Streptomyces sp. CC219B]|uniref:Rv3235 family protein n=1 Tax=Streptomyces sp. CC219B TaxID=3044574 RepID=UPI0024A9D99F|nr:Rv3235 family protein [Streptomyces sp. CC219B]
MNKVMTRAQGAQGQHPGARPPGRRDTRRPGGTPPRTPGPGSTRTATPEGRPPASPTSTRLSTRPRDTRPTPAPGRSNTTPNARTTPPGQSTALHPLHPLQAPQISQDSPTAPSPSVPPQTPRRPVPALPTPVTQPRPTDVFADRLLAVLSGQRPVHCMLRHTAGRAYDDLAWLAERGPLRTTRGSRPVVRDIGYYVPSPGAIEAFARIGAGDRLRAMAFRLEQGRDLRWRCTAVELGGPRRPRANDD